MSLDNSEVVKNLKIGIMKDLCKSGFITQKQMEGAVMKLSREDLMEGAFQNELIELDTASPLMYNEDGFRKQGNLLTKL